MSLASTVPAPVHASLLRAHALAALAALLLSALFGVLVALQLVWPDLIGSAPALGWGRLRFAHTQGIMLGWLGNAFLAFLYHAVPVLTQRAVSHPLLGWALFGLWNAVAVIPGWVLVLAGVSQPLEWAEFPPVVDAAVLVALLLAAAQFLPGFFRSGLDSLYVSGWYIVGGLSFTLLAYPMGNVVPALVSGATSAAFSGLWIHDAVGLFVTPLALAILYYVIPATSGRPIYSHFLSMLGFWGLFFFYPLNGTHHYVFSVIPMAAQLGAITASALLGVVVVIVVGNLLLSLRGEGWLPRDAGLRFVAVAVVFYFVVSMQGAAQAQMALNRFTHFSDWVIGHAHLAMLGFATFAAIGGLVHAWQRLPAARYNPRAISAAFWLLTFGISAMVIDLTLAGLVQGELWQAATPWMDSVRASRPYWLLRVLTALPIVLGFLLLGVGLLTGEVGAGLVQTAAGSAVGQRADVAAPPPASSRGLGMAYVVSGVAGVGFFGLSLLVLGLWPGRVIDAEVAATAPAPLLALTDSEQRGRQIYAREGCGYCHTQQIRFLEEDIRRFGAPNLAWELQFDSPHLWGTRRIGPDLSREAGVRSSDWHYAHLFAPRALVADSVMPSYAALFDGAPTRPRQAARDLVAYLETLGRARQLAWPEGEQQAQGATMDTHRAHLAFSATELNAHPAKARRGGALPDLAGVTAANDGAALWRVHCASCHGAAGRGDGIAAAWLRPAPANLTEYRYTRDYLLEVLWNGVAGSSMPAWRDQSPATLLALVDVVESLSGNDPAPSTAAATLALGAEVYAAHCAQCHGQGGRGDGFAAAEFRMAAVDFTRQQPSHEQALRALEEGVAGSPMAPWRDRLDTAERDAVVHYLRTFFAAPAAGVADAD